MEHYQVEEHRYVQETPAYIALQQLNLELEELLQQAKIDDAVLMPQTMQAVVEDITAILARMREETLEVDTLYTIQNIMNTYTALNDLYIKKIEEVNLKLQSYIYDNSLS